MSPAAALMNQATAIAASSSKKQQQQQLARMVTLFAAIVLLTHAVLVAVPAVEARYLPTRSNTDQVRRQEIKEILRLLLDLPSEEQQQRGGEWNHMAPAVADLFELNPAAAAARVSAQRVAEDSRAKRDTSQTKANGKSHQGPF